MSTQLASLCGRIAPLLLVLCCSLAGSAAAQETTEPRTSQSLRSLLGLPAQPAVDSAAPRVASNTFDQLEEPLLVPITSDRNALPSTLFSAAPAMRYEFQDTMREQTRQQLNNFMRPMSEVSIDIREPNVRLPRDRSTELQNYVMNDWTVTGAPELAVWWAAPNIRYGQLYFENVALERYGQTCGPYKQVAASAAHLFCSVWAVPFQMWTAPAGSCDTPLGYCRPGSATDLQRQRFILWR